MKRSGGTARRLGTITQVMVVAVLLLAVVWQINGAKPDSPDSPEDSGPPAPVNRIEEQARPYITTDEVNLRRGPGTDHEIISVMPLHAELLVTGDGQNGFVPVNVNGTAAWVAAEYVIPEGSVLGSTTGDVAIVETPPPTEAPAPPTEAPLPTEPPVVEPLPTEPAPAPTEAPVVADVAVAAQETIPEPTEALPLVASTRAGNAEQPALQLTGEGERWVDVNRTTGIITLYEGERVVATFEGLVGRDPSPDGFYSTATGTFHVHMMNEALAETPFADGVYLSHFVGFDWERSNGFHSPTKDAQGNLLQTGGTTTLGCVRLGEDEARLMYDFAFIGMRVEIHD